MEAENELNIKISATMQKAIDSLDKIIPKLKETDSTINKMLVHMDSKGKLSGFTAELKELGSEMDKTTKKSSSLMKTLNFGILYAGVRKLGRTSVDWLTKSIDYSEALNLFNVVLDESIDKGMKFQNVMNEAFGTNQESTLTYQGLYQSMAENMGITAQYAYIMSENTTKMVNDISSLYNKSESITSEALRAGIFAGQTKPLRSFGLDVTQQTLQPLLDSFNIKNEDGTAKTVRQLSQAEKQILRYLAVLQQSSIAHGDWANTIESPSNQLKIFSNQLIEAQRALSNLFIKTFGNILPYANAILMVIKEVANAIASMFGIEVSDYNTSIASQENAYIDLEDSIDGATGSLKELKRQTLGFDQINNINENKDSGSGSELVGGIDQRLLDAISGYDNGMDSVRMKATEIRDRIMEWLGFTKEIDPLTGKVSFSLKDGYTNLKLIGGLIATWAGLKLITKVGSLGSGMLSLFQNVSKTKTGVDKLTGSTAKAQTGFQKFSTILNKLVIGIGGAVISYNLISNATKNLETNTGSLISNLGQLSIGFAGMVGSGALIGSVFGPVGAMAGAVGGAFLGLISAIDGYNKGLESIAKSNIYGQLTLTAEQLMEITSGIGNNFANETKIIENYKNSMGTLEDTFNSSITTIERYGLMYGTVQQKISQEEAPKIIESITELGNNTKSIIEESTNYSLDLWTSMMTGSTSVTKEEQTNIIKAITENGAFMRTEVERIQGNITTTYETAIATRGYLTDEEYNYVSEQLGKLRALTSIAMSTAKTDLTMLQNDINSGRLNLSEEGYNQLIGQIKEKEKLATDEAWSIRRKAYEDAEQQKKIMELAGKSAEEIATVYSGQMKIADEQYSKAISENQKQVLTLMETLEKTVESKRKEYVGNAGEWGQTLYGKITGAYTKIYTDEEKATIKHYDSMLGNLRTYKSDLTKKYDELGTDTVTGYIDGLNKSTDELKNATGRVFEWVPATTKETLDSHSPSRRLMQIGEDTIQGYMDGIMKKSSSLNKTVADLMENIEKMFGSKTFNINISTNVESSFNTILNKLEQFTNKFRDGINSMLSKFNSSMNGIKIGTDGKVTYTSMPYISIPRFENGGLPPTGQLFMAREAGPELVGQIGNKTAVVNNNQIVDGIKAGVYEAVSMAMSNGGQAVNVNINAKTEKGVILETAVDGINEFIKSTGELPFPVPAK